MIAILYISFMLVERPSSSIIGCCMRIIFCWSRLESGKGNLGLVEVEWCRYNVILHCRTNEGWHDKTTDNRPVLLITQQRSLQSLCKWRAVVGSS